MKAFRLSWPAVIQATVPGKTELEAKLYLAIMLAEFPDGIPVKIDDAMADDTIWPQRTQGQVGALDPSLATVLYETEVQGEEEEDEEQEDA